MKPRRILLVVLGLCLGASSTTVIPMSVERLTRASTDVVRARALASWSAWDAAHTRIFTYTRFAVLQRLKGRAASIFVVKQMGGSAGGYTQHVAGVRPFVSGEDSLLFLHPSQAADGTLVVTGLMQGNFRVTRSPSGDMVSNGIPGVNTFDPRTRRLGAYGGTSMTLREAESRVLAVHP